MVVASQGISSPHIILGTLGTLGMLQVDPGRPEFYDRFPKRGLRSSCLG